MNALPVVSITRDDGGHRITCSCDWTAFRYSRVAADQVAMEHRASHGRGRELAPVRTTAKEAKP